MLKAAYPQYYRGLNNTDLEAVVRLWETLFKEDKYADVAIAVHTLITTRTDTFPPVIGEVKQALREVTRPDEMTAQSAWAEVMKCVKRGGYHAAEDWALLPDVIKAAISPEQIKSMAMSEDFNESVEKSLFFRTWNTVTERKRVADTVPASIRAEIEKRKAAFSVAADTEPQKIETKAEKTEGHTEEHTVTATGTGDDFRELYKDFSVAAFLKQERLKRERMEVIS